MEENERILNAENSLAGAILIDGRCMELIPPELQREDFQNPVCRTVFEAAMDLRTQGKRLDPLTIMEWAAIHGRPISRQSIANLMEVTPTCEGAGDYARMVHESGLRRRIAQLVAEFGRDKATPLHQLLTMTQDKLLDLMSESGTSGIITASEVEYEPPRWLIEPYIQRGKGTMIQADPGTGKTALACALAAAVSTGKGFLGLEVKTPGNVLMLSTEDDLGVLRGRIEANGGDLNKVFFCSSTAGLTLNDPQIETIIRTLQAKMVIFDPFQAFLGSQVDLFRANETRPILANLFEMCDRNDCACVIVAHLGKMTKGKSAVNQSLGSVDIPGAMRSILHITRNPSMPDQVVAFHIKSSNAPSGKSFTYTIGDRGAVTFQGYTDLTMEELYSTKETDEFDQDIVLEALTGLQKERGAGFISYEDIHQTLRDQVGYSPFRSSKELRSLLERPAFQRQLQQAGIQMSVGVRNSSKRGIRLGSVDMTDMTNRTNRTMKTIPDHRHDTVDRLFAELPDEDFPWS